VPAYEFVEVGGRMQQAFLDVPGTGAGARTAARAGASGRGEPGGLAAAGRRIRNWRARGAGPRGRWDRAGLGTARDPVRPGRRSVRRHRQGARCVADPGVTAAPDVLGVLLAPSGLGGCGVALKECDERLRTACLLATLTITKS